MTSFDGTVSVQTVTDEKEDDKAIYMYSPVLVIFHVKNRKKSENYEHHGKL